MGVGDDARRGDAVAEVVGVRVVAMELEPLDARAEARERLTAAPPERAQTSLPSFCSTLPVIPGSSTITSLTGVPGIAAPSVGSFY